jgi:hypothetical protein
LKLPSSVTLLLDHHKWQYNPDLDGYVKDGTVIYITYTLAKNFIVQVTKMSKVWSSIVTSDELNQIIRTTKPPKNKE